MKLQQTRRQISDLPMSVPSNISSIFLPYDLPHSIVNDITKHLSNSPKLIDFLMQFQHTLPKPDNLRPFTCAITIALGYFVGGFVPLLPYFFVAKNDVLQALYWSIGIMILALFSFGYVKSCMVSGWRGTTKVVRGTIGGAQTVIVGSAAAGASMGVVKVFATYAAG